MWGDFNKVVSSRLPPKPCDKWACKEQSSRSFPDSIETRWENYSMVVRGLFLSVDFGNPPVYFLHYKSLDS